MGLLDLFKRNKKNIVVIVQCRLSSTRLPKKALLPLGDRCVLEWTLNAMKKVQASKYYLAVDTESEEELKPVAKKCGFEVFAGSRDDVLDRFCKVIELSKADIVVRATADNPFLFYDAANDMVREYMDGNMFETVDYMTYSGLPHGSGVEMFKGESLLKARGLTSLPYDHEHVGPALYNHPENFKSMFIPAPEKYNFPKLRTTIDTPTDFRKARAVLDLLSGDKKIKPPFTSGNVLGAYEKLPFLKNPVLLVPSVEKGHGTGHLRRCLSLAKNLGCHIYIPSDCTLDSCTKLVEEFCIRDYQRINNLDWAGDYSVIILDMFRTSEIFMKELEEKIAGGGTSVVSFDEGGSCTDSMDYLLDIIPSSELERNVNMFNPMFIPLPSNRKESRSLKIRNAVVSIGGEDPANLTGAVSRLLAACGIKVTAICSSQEQMLKFSSDIPENLKPMVEALAPVDNLSEMLWEYDLVVTHYGFTAFEALSAKCAVILVGTTKLHEELARKYNFALLGPGEMNEDAVRKILSEPETLYSATVFRKTADRENDEEISLSDFVTTLSRGIKYDCPVCQEKIRKDKCDMLVSRVPGRTFRRCRSCGMLYISWALQSNPTEYNRAYFFDDYEKQYGKTYIDDFKSIKAQGVRRVSNIDFIFRKGGKGESRLLDIGCAMGPFLDAANDAGWRVYGTDISSEAIDYVTRTFNYPAVQANFPDADFEECFGVRQFDVVTMWYVIEHFQNLDAVLSKVSSIVKKDGIFAFSTPSASGVSGKFNSRSFFENSPPDHYSLWEIKKVKTVLSRYGFDVRKIVSTGIHPERLPYAKKHNIKQNSFMFHILNIFCRIFKLGDTFEVYCKKVK